MVPYYRPASEHGKQSYCNKFFTALIINIYNNTVHILNTDAKVFCFFFLEILSLQMETNLQNMQKFIHNENTPRGCLS